MPISCPYCNAEIPIKDYDAHIDIINLLLSGFYA